MRGRANSQFAASARPTRSRRLEREAVGRVARGVDRAERAPGEPADRDGRHAGASERQAVGEDARPAVAGAAARRPDAASRGASRPRERGAARRRGSRGELALLVDGVEVHDHGARAAPRRALAAKTRAPTSPNSSAPVIRIPVRGLVEPFGRGERRGHAGPVVSRARRACRGAARRPASAPASTASAAPTPAERAPGRCPRSRASASAVSTATAQADHPHRHQPSGHRLRLRLGVEVGHDPAAHRRAAARGDQVGVLAASRRRAGASRGRRRRPAAASSAEPTGQSRAAAQPGAPRRRRAAGTAASASAAEARAEDGKAVEAPTGAKANAGARPGSPAPRGAPRRDRAPRAAPGVPASRGAARSSSHRLVERGHAEADSGGGGLLGALLGRSAGRPLVESAALAVSGVIVPASTRSAHVLLERLGAELLAAVGHVLAELARCGSRP